jgi:cellulose biosynthesis protein BcsQ
MAKHVISAVNQKGGVGKTNVVANVAAELAAQGRSVTVIDLDPQATLTRFLFSREVVLGTAEVLAGEALLADVAIPIAGFGVKLVASIPVPMRRTIRMLESEVGSERVLPKP